MGGIKLVLFAVLCSADSLSCIDVPTSQYAFETPDQCEQQLQHTVTRLRHTNSFYTTPMGRCRYLLIEDKARPAELSTAPSLRIEQAFRLVDQTETDGETLTRVRVAAQKANRLSTKGCDANQLEFPPHCAADGDGSGSKPRPTVTVEYPAGNNASILVPLPPDLMAAHR